MALNLIPLPLRESVADFIRERLIRGGYAADDLVIVLTRDKSGDWNTSWLNCRASDLAFAAVLLNEAALQLARGDMPGVEKSR